MYQVTGTKCYLESAIKVTTILERKNSSRSLERVNFGTQTNTNAFYAGISKSITVASGYYYRVRSHHYASTDSAISYSSALWNGN